MPVVQYSSSEYVDELKSHGFEIGITRIFNLHNAMIKSFFKTFGYNRAVDSTDRILNNT
jgi:hypothetical protein